MESQGIDYWGIYRLLQRKKLPVQKVVATLANLCTTQV